MVIMVFGFGVVDVDRLVGRLYSNIVEMKKMIFNMIFLKNWFFDFNMVLEVIIDRNLVRSGDWGL